MQKIPTRLEDWMSLERFDPAMRERLKKEFEAGRANPHEQDTTMVNTSRASALIRVERITSDSSLLREATSDRIARVLLAVGRVLNYATNVNTVMQQAKAMTKATPPWTVAEVDALAVTVPNDPDLGKEASYSQSITPNVCASARKRWAVRAGRLFSPKELRYTCARYAPLTEESRREASKAFVPVEIDGADMKGSRMFRLVHPEILTALDQELEMMTAKRAA